VERGKRGAGQKEKLEKTKLKFRKEKRREK
jgi:hypothetical protein